MVLDARPGMDGFEVTRALRSPKSRFGVAQPEYVPFCDAKVESGDVDEHVDSDVRSFGVDDLIARDARCGVFVCLANYVANRVR